MNDFDRLLARQYGVFSRAQARQSGLTDRQIDRRLAMGRFITIGPGVCRIASAPRTDLGDLLGATLRTRGIASHRSAAALYRLIPKHPKSPEVTVGPGSSYRRDVVAHRSFDLEPTDIVLVDGIRTTSPARTLLDVASTFSLRRLEVATHDAVTRGLTDPDSIVGMLSRVSRKGRPGGPRLRTVLDRLGWTDACESPLETRLLQELLDHGLPTPVRQHRLVIEGRAIRLDFAYPPEKIALEADGYAAHAARKAFERDRSRNNLLTLHGWLVLRFTSDSLQTAPGAAALQVRAALDARRSRSA